METTGRDVNGNPVAAREDRVLEEIVGRLVAAYKPLQVYLFGSKARGDAGPDSDYDLLLVVPDDASPERRCSRLAYEVLHGTGAASPRGRGRAGHSED